MNFAQLLKVYIWEREKECLLFFFHIDKEEKTAVRKSFLKCLKDLHLHTVNELSNAKNSPPKKVLKRAVTAMDNFDLDEPVSKEKEE